MPKQQKVCAICGKSSSLVCGKCKSANYCSQACQKQHWKHHKKTCGKSVFVDRPMVVGDKCTRCLEIIKADANGNPILIGCRVPHPEDMQQTMTTSFGPDGTRMDMYCQACNCSYQCSTSDRTLSKSEAPITSGPQYCFEGFHTLLPPERLGDRRIKSDLVVLHAGPDLQQEIDALDGNEDVAILRICSDDYFCSERDPPRLKIKLPNLKEFQLEDVSMGQIHLTEELTPNVEIISMQNPSEDDDPDFVIECARLKTFKCYYWGFGNPRWPNEMLKHATKLESFDSYKFRVPFLKFASNHLVSIRLHRAECLQYLELYAPRLTILDVQAAYDLDKIVFKDDHPTLKSKLPANFAFGEQLHVNAVNALLGPTAKQAILSHPRFRGELKEQDSDDEYF